MFANPLQYGEKVLAGLRCVSIEIQEDVCVRNDQPLTEDTVIVGELRRLMALEAVEESGRTGVL